MRLGIIGSGYIVQLVLPHLVGWGIDVAALCGTPETMGQVAAMADDHKITARYDDWAELVADPSVDTVYVAVPNFLHFAAAKAALEAGKDVICEKPLAASEHETAALAALARERRRFLWEAVVTTRQPNFVLVRDELLPRLGAVKVAIVNYSQYSSRYDAFRAGEVLPAFDPAMAGGAIMDLGLYTLTYTIGLFGEPAAASYRPNIERGIDTSGIVDLDYDGFRVVNVCAKDCVASSGVTIQGTDGCITMDTPPNMCGPVVITARDGTSETYDRSLPVMWEGEFREFARQQDEGDLAECYRQLEMSLVVSGVQNRVRREAGVVFPGDAA